MCSEFNIQTSHIFLERSDGLKDMLKEYIEFLALKQVGEKFPLSHMFGY